VTLCNLVNKFQAGIVRKINKPGMPFKEMENITMYINACKSLGVRPGNVFRPPDLYEKRSSYPKAIIQNLLSLEKATEKLSGGSPKKTFAYQQSSPSPAPAPVEAAAPAGTYTFSNVASFSNDSPASPSRTVAHSPTPKAEVVHGSYDHEHELERQRARGAASSQVAGQPDWVKNAKNAQEAADMVAAKVWMEAVVGEPFIDGDLWETTKSGVYLCKMINKVKPGTVKKYSKMSSNLPFKCMENMTLYLEGCERLGMRSGKLFRPPDLYEKRVSYPKAIINNIHGLAKIADDLPGYKGPRLEVKSIAGNSF